MQAGASRGGHRIGALDVDDFMPLKERKSLAAALNTLLASPTFASWRQGVSLDIGEWLTPKEGRTPAIIVSVAHLDSNAGFWAVGRLQTDADRARVVDSLANINEPGSSEAELSDLIRRLGKRWFLVRDVHSTPNTILLQPRWALSFLRGPMTPGDVRRALERGKPRAATPV